MFTIFGRVDEAEHRVAKCCNVVIYCSKEDGIVRPYRFRAAVSVLIGPCCPALLKSYSCKCTYCGIIEQINDDDDDNKMRPNVTSLAWHISHSIVSCAKTAEQTEMPFGMWTRWVASGNHV